MSKNRFPHIILEGDKAAASRLIRRGMAELFRTEQLMEVAGKDMWSRTVNINDTDSIQTLIAKGVKKIRIHAVAPKPKAKKEGEEEEFDYSLCPPAFVLYARKEFDGSTDKDYIIAYNRTIERWVTASVEGYEGAANTGYWYNDDGAKPCNLITWHGQQGGFNQWQPINQKAYFYEGGQKINGPIDRNIIGACKVENVYYLLTYGETDSTLESWKWGSSIGDWISTGTYAYEGPGLSNLSDGIGSGIPAPTHTTWGNVANAFVNSNGEAFIVTPITIYVPPQEPANSISANIVTARATYMNCPHYIRINLITGALYVIDNNIENVPTVVYNGRYDDTNAPSFTESEYTVTRDRTYWDSSSDQSTLGTISLPTGSANEFVISRTVSASNLGRPFILRGFGGLSSMFTYELEIAETAYFSQTSYTSNFSFIPPTVFREGTVYTNGPCSPGTFWYSYTDTSPGVSWRNNDKFSEVITQKATIYCYDRGTSGLEKKLVSSIALRDFLDQRSHNVWHTSSSGYVDMSYLHSTETSTLYGLIQETHAILPVPDKMRSRTDSSSCSNFWRQVLDHHPQIDSWSYIESEYDMVGGYDQNDYDSNLSTNNQAYGTKSIDYYELGTFVQNSTGGRFLRNVGFYGTSPSIPSHGFVIDDAVVTSPISTPNSCGTSYTEGWTMPAGPRYDFMATPIRYTESGYGHGPYTSVPLLSPFVPEMQKVSFTAKDYKLLDEPNLGIDFSYFGSAIDTDAAPILFPNNDKYDHTIGGGLGKVAVHRPLKKGGKRPYIWLKHKAHAALVLSNTSVPGFKLATETSSTYAFETVPSPTDKMDWPAHADAGEWYIESNILSEEQIKKLTEEASTDIIGIGVI